MVPVVAAPEIPLVDDVAAVGEVDEADVVDELDDDADEFEPEPDSPHVFLPELRSSPMTLKVALFAPSAPFWPVRRLNQHGVADVKLSRTGALALNPGAFC